MADEILLNGIEYLQVDVRTESIFNYVDIIRADSGAVLGYRVKHNIAYYSKRYRKWVTVEAKDVSDGATGVKDIDSFSWVFHDELCEEGKFDDGSKCNNWQASNVLSDILSDENRWFREYTWFVGTWLFGGGKARENGMF